MAQLEEKIMSTDRFSTAIEFLKNPPPRMAANTPVDALVVFDGWMGGSVVTHDIFVKLTNGVLKKGEVYSVAEIVHVDGSAKVVLNEARGQWDITFFAAYK